MIPLTEYQEAFVDDFLRESSERAHFLIAPPGSGVGACVLEILSRLFMVLPQARVLLLSERIILVQQWMTRLRDTSAPTRSLEGSRHTLLSLLEGGNPSHFRWPESSIVTMLTGSIERSGDLHASVFQTPWNLLVWDGFIPSSDKLRLLSELGNAENIQRILISSSNPNATSVDLIPGINKTTWDWSLLLSQSEEKAVAPLTLVLLTYIRTPKEEELRQQVENLAKTITAKQEPDLRAKGLLVAADSSPLALRDRLRQFQRSKASIAVGEITSDELASPEEEDTEPNASSNEAEMPASEYFEEARKIQFASDDLTMDSKLESVQKYLEQQSSRSHIVILCRFSATATYLKSALIDLNKELFTLTAEQNRLSIIEAFNSNGGILIATFAGLQGLESSADSIILYDLVPNRLEGAVGLLLQRFRSNKPVQLVSIEDAARPTNFIQQIIHTVEVVKE